MIKNCLVEVPLLRKLIIDRAQFKLLYPVLARRPLSQQEETELNKATLVDPSQQIINLYELSEVKKPNPYKVIGKTEFQDYATRMSLASSDTIIIFDRTIYLSTRLWWILQYFGYQKVYLLNGGFQAWQQEQGVADSATTLLEYEPCQQGIISYKEMTQRDPERFEVVDTRPEQFFDLGNIKGSKSLPWESLLDTRGRFLEVDDIVKLLASHDINLAKPIVASCQTGKTSTVLNVALQQLGKGSVLYDGSYLEYSSTQM